MQNILLVTKTSASAAEYIEALARETKTKSSAVLEFNQSPEGLTIEECREIIKLTERDFREPTLFVIHEFQNLSEIIQNTLLKVLEEHQETIGFVLISKSLTQVLPTVRSRCRVVNLRAQSEVLKTDEIEQIQALLGKLETTPTLLASQELSLGIKNKKEKAILFLDTFLRYGEKYLATSKKQATLANYLRKAIFHRNLIENNNIEPEIALDQVFLS